MLLSENKDEILYGYGLAKAGREQLHRVDRALVAAIQDTPYGSERSSPTGNASSGSIPTSCSTRSTSTR